MERSIDEQRFRNETAGNPAFESKNYTKPFQGSKILDEAKKNRLDTVPILVASNKTDEQIQAVSKTIEKDSPDYLKIALIGLVAYYVLL